MFSGVAGAPPVYFKNYIKGKTGWHNNSRVSALTECKNGGRVCRSIGHTLIKCSFALSLFFLEWFDGLNPFVDLLHLL
jgi:hypothetical protein